MYPSHSGRIEGNRLNHFSRKGSKDELLIELKIIGTLPFSSFILYHNLEGLEIQKEYSDLDLECKSLITDFLPFNHSKKGNGIEAIANPFTSNFLFPYNFALVKEENSTYTNPELFPKTRKKQKPEYSLIIPTEIEKIRYSKQTPKVN